MFSRALAILSLLLYYPLQSSEELTATFCQELIEHTYHSSLIEKIEAKAMPLALEQLTIHESKRINALFLQVILLDILHQLPNLSIDTFFTSCKQPPSTSVLLTVKDTNVVKIALFTSQALLPAQEKMASICAADSGYLLFPSLYVGTAWEHTLLRMLFCKNCRIKIYNLPIEGFTYQIVTWRPNTDPIPQKPPSKHALTYQLSGGRLGDNLLSYLHALWISYKYNIKLLLQPFPLSPFFELNKKARRKLPPFQKIVTVKKEEDIFLEDPEPTLYIIPYFPENREITKGISTYPLFQVVWEDTTFQSLVKKSTQLKSFALKNSTSSYRTLTVGIHVRMGGGFDPITTQKQLPLKFPPLSYYAKAIQRLLELMPYTPMEFFLFTDDDNPQSLKEKLEALIEKEEVAIHCRKSSIYDPLSQIKDFQDLQQCDALIIPQSNFSLVASKISDPWLVITPTGCEEKDENTLIVATQIAVNGAKKKTFPIKIPKENY